MTCKISNKSTNVVITFENIDMVKNEDCFFIVLDFDETPLIELDAHYWEYVLYSDNEYKNRFQLLTENELLRKNDKILRDAIDKISEEGVNISQTILDAKLAYMKVGDDKGE